MRRPGHTARRASSVFASQTGSQGPHHPGLYPAMVAPLPAAAPRQPVVRQDRLVLVGSSRLPNQADSLFNPTDRDDVNIGLAERVATRSVSDLDYLSVSAAADLGPASGDREAGVSWCRGVGLSMGTNGTCSETWWGDEGGGINTIQSSQHSRRCCLARVSFHHQSANRHFWTGDLWTHVPPMTPFGWRG